MEDFELGQLLHQLSGLYQIKEADRTRQGLKSSPQQKRQLDYWLDCSKALPQAPCLARQGWDFYYRYDYESAFACFKEAVAEEGVALAGTALGFAKVYTRTGQWDLGRRWALYYLHLARNQLDDYNIAKGYGALAELFLRGDRPQEALACFQIAYQLMPLEHSKKGMQLNFMASALARNNEWFRARLLLNASRQASKIHLHNQRRGKKKHKEAVISLLHSTVRLAFIDIAQTQSGQLPKDDLPDGFCNILDELLTKTERKQHCYKIPIAFLYAADALVDIAKERSATENLTNALQQLQGTSTQEYHWLARLLDTKQASTLPTLAVVSPPSCHTTILDRTWQVTLSDDGFGCLNTASFEALQKLWKLFFI